MSDTLTGALASVQATLPTINKGKKAKVKMKQGGEYSYTYADLSDISPAVFPLLANVGLAWVAAPTYEDQRFVLRYSLRHTSGEEVTGAYPLPHPSERTPQEMGSAITYARRYTFCAVVGVVADEDDDGHTANSKPAASKAKPKPPTAPHELLAEAKTAVGVVKGVGSLKGQLLTWWAEQNFPGIDSLTEAQCHAVLDHCGELTESVPNGEPFAEDE